MLKSLCFIAIAANVILSVSATGYSGVCGGRINERWVQCPNGCGPKNCSEVGYPKPCPRSSDSSHCLSKPGCVCEDGFVRNDYGKCIPITSCPCCGGDENAVSGCGNCPTTCSNYKIKDQISCLQICYPNACDCKKGYVLDVNTKKCVKLEDCTPQCGKNETFSTCVNGGCHTGRTCDELKRLNGSTICVRPEKCQPGCLCKKGYVRDSNGVCIPENDCPSKKCSSRKNEHWEQCIDDCLPRSCSELGYPLPCKVLNSNGTCPTKSGCVCDDGLVWNDKGICIPAKQCPSCGGDKNAESGCGNCRKTCRSLNSHKPPICPLYCNLNGCNCKEGYVYDEITDKCVLPKNCSPPCGSKEVFDYCVNGGCHHGRTCKGLDSFNGSTICIDPIKCLKGCLCEEGYVRNNAGECIPEYECPGKNCGGRKNEQFVECPNDCAPKKCSELGYPVGCPGQTVDGSCPVKAGCVCDSGFKRADNGTCIPIQQCPSCGGDENAHSGCGNCPKTCSNYNSTEPQICLQYCDLNGCDCNEGYVLDEIVNKCVLPKNCSPPCGKNEELNYCVNGGCHEAKTCKDLDTINGTLICENPTECKRGCACKYGYLRDSKGVCIPENKCPNSKCKGELETYVPCNYKCAPERCDQLGYPLNCLLPSKGPCPGKPACLCRVGYVRNIKGKCIPLDQCPSCGGDPNARSGCGGYCGRRCSNYNKGPIACPLVCQINGCDCLDGFVYDDNIGKCVPPEKCTPVCGQNEQYTSCIENCSEGRCGQKSNSNSVSSRHCTVGCVCRDGFVRNSNGVCVAKNECSLNDKCSARPYEFWDTCPPNCSPETCSSIGQVIDCPPQAAVCRPRCRCAEGYKRNDRGMCIPEIQCNQCGKNETYDLCFSPCPPRVCGTNIAAISCLRIEPEDCKGGCRCQDDYYRNKQGDCVAENDCPPENPCTKANEVYDVCPSKCPPRVCGIDDTLIDCAPGPNPGDPDCPPPTCRCANGYYRDNKGQCVKWKNCPKCPKHQVYDPCPNPCPPQLCSVDERVIKCKAPPQVGDDDCKAGCRCEDGYKKNDTGICIPKEQCPSPPCGSKEVFDYCVNGGCHHGRTCKELDSFNGSTICIDLIKCLKGCLCEEGYVRNNAGECIPEYECPGKNCGGRKNEQFVECPNDCAPKKCSELGYPVGCPGQTVDGSCPVKAGCVCDSGFKRADNGTCIPIQQCPSCGGDENAHSGCGNCPKTCSNYNSTEPQICLQYCDLNGCDCNEGYVLDEIVNKCVLPKNCSPPCGKNEELNYCVNGGCHEAKTCKDLDTINGTLICENPTECKRGCACKYGYLRDSKGVCIPENECPNSKCKGELETYVPCNYKCAPERCDQLGYPLNCLLPSKGPCPGKPACLCRVGYVRNIKGKCIPLDQCPSCGGDPNARSGCGGYCGRRCSNYNKGPIACPLVCQINGCDCLDGFVYDDNIGKCVPPEKCTPVCGQNEQYTSCIENCSEGRCGQKSNSNSVSSRHCTVGCVCRDGFVRNSNGVCVAKNECSLNDKCSARPYEFWDTCPPNCSPETCSSIGQVIDCPPQAAVCRPRCRCAEGYKRNDRGMCIPEIQCNQCGKNETYDLCFSPCPPRVCGTNIAAISCLRIEPEDCKGGCRCQDDYYRNKQGDCVAENDCPPENPCTKANEVYDVCPSKCPPRVCGIDDTLIDCAPGPNPGDPDCPPPTCRCANGYYRDNKGQCVKWKNCPKCPKHQVYDPCPNPCPPQLCSVDERVIKCKAPPQVGDDDCKAGCRCEDGYKKNDTGICIPKEQCPSPLCPTHEIFDLCPANCPPETCPDGRVYKCPAPPKPGSADCKPRCRCKDNYYRNEKGICIPKKQCPLICSGPHEYYACGGACDNVCSTLSQQNQTYCPIINIKCNDKCYCEEGYARDGQGICVPISSCRSCNGDPNAQPGCGCSRTCSDYYANKEPTCTKECKVGACDCKKGYVREEKTGKCILPKDCPATKCPKNEIFDLCPASCPPESCPDGIIYRCAAPPKPGSADCKPRCRCKDNYYRNEEGYCVSKDQCPQSCSGSDESWDPCPDPCAPTTCEDLYNTRACTYAYTEVKQCCGACRCNSGYFRNILGQCISKENCLKCTKPHEYFSCGVACDNVCATLSQQNQTSCPIINVKCNEKCYCEKDYARDSNDNCIPISSCPSCNGDPNAEPGCCGQTCSNYNATKELPCNKFCTQNICQCKKGYALDESSGKCVLPKNCPCE